MSNYQSLHPAPGEPPAEIEENALPWRSPIDTMPDWTGVRTDDWMQDRLAAMRKMTIEESTEIASPFRSDRRPENFSMASFIVSDIDLGNGAAGDIIRDNQTDWPVWAIMIRPIKNPILGTSPANAISVTEWGIDAAKEFLNLPAPVSSISVMVLGAPVAGVAGAGWEIVYFDRWIPPPVSAVSSGGGGASTVTIAPSTTGTHTDVAQNAASVVILAANVNRKGATIVNDSAAILYLRLEAAAAALADYTVALAPLTGGIGGYYEVPFNYNGEIRGIWAAAGAGAARVTEFT